MFSKPLKHPLDSTEKGYIKGMFYEDLHNTINKSLAHLVEKEKKAWIRDMWQSYSDDTDEFLDAMRTNGWLPEHIEANLRSAQKRVSDLEDMISRNLDKESFIAKYGNNKDKPYVDRIVLEAQLEEAKKQLKNAN